MKKVPSSGLADADFMRFIASCIILFVSLLVFPKKKVRCARARKGAKYAWEFSRKCNLQHSRKYILLGNSLTIFQCSRGKHAQRSCDGQWRNDVVAKNNVLHVMLILLPDPFIRHSLIWHGLPNYSLTIHLFSIIIVMIINLDLLYSTFDYKSIHIKFVS